MNISEILRQEYLKILGIDTSNLSNIELQRMASLKVINEGIGGAISVEDNHFFVDTTTRDSYFVTNPSELEEKMYCVVNGTLQQYKSSSWVDVSAVVRGEKGEDGAGLTDETQTITGVKAFDTVLTAGNVPTETWGTNYGVLKLGQNCSLASNKTAKGGMFVNQNMYWNGSWKRINDGVASSVVMSTNGSCKYFVDETDLADTEVTLSNPVFTISTDKKLGIGTDVPEKSIHSKFTDNNGLLLERNDTGVNGLKTIEELRSVTSDAIDTGYGVTNFGAYTDYFVEDNTMAGTPKKIGLLGVSVDDTVDSGKLQFIPYKNGSPNINGLFKIDSDGTMHNNNGYNVTDTYTPSADGTDEKNVLNQNSQLSLTEDYNVTGVEKSLLNQDLEILDSSTSTTATNFNINGIEQNFVNNKEISLGRLRGYNSTIENNGAYIGYLDGVKTTITTGSNSDIPNLHGGSISIINSGTSYEMTGLDIHLRNNGGTVTNMYGLKLSRVPFGYVAPSNSYALHIEELGGTNNYGIYQKGKCNNELQGTFKIGSYSTAEMNGLTDIDGMQIYNTETKNIHINDGTKWNKISKTINLTDEVQTNSYRKSVIALCSVDNTVNDLSSFSSGKLIFKRPNGLQGGLSIDFNIEKLYNTEQINIDYVIRGMEFIEIKPCTFTYNSKKFGGLSVHISESAHSEVYFEGETNFDIFGADYYDTQNTTALITEINDSINSTTSVNLKDNFYVNGNRYSNPIKTVYSSGFATDWSGSITARKTGDGMINLVVYIEKSSDISSSFETVYTLDEKLRPAETITTTIAGNNHAIVAITTTGLINVIATGDNTAIEARSINYTSITYFQDN